MCGCYYSPTETKQRKQLERKMKVKLNEGINGSGKKVWLVSTERAGSKGQTIRHIETFTSKSEAESWIKYAL